MRRVDPFAHLHAHNRSKAAVAQLGFDHRQQIVGFLFVALGIGIAGDPEELAGFDLHVGKQSSRLCAITSSSGTKCRVLPARIKRGIPAPSGTLIRAMSCSPPCRVAHVTKRLLDRLETKGNGWAGSIASGVTSGKMFLQIMLADLGALFIGQLVIGHAGGCRTA